MNEAEEVRGSTIVARGDTPEVLESIETSFDLVSMGIDVAIVWDGDFSAAGRRDDDFGAHYVDLGAERGAVVGFVGENVFRDVPLEEGGCRGDIVALAAR